MKRIKASKNAKIDILRIARFRHELRRRKRRLDKRLGRTPSHDFARKENLPYDPLLKRKQIIIPTDFSLHSNFDETVDALNQIRKFALDERCPVMLHFSRTSKVEPAAALSLVSEIHRVRGIRGPKFITGTYPRAASVYTSLSEMGFFAVLNILDRDVVPETPAEPGRPVFLRFISETRVIPELADRFVTIVEKALFPMNDLARQRLVVAIKEAMQNTLDHAHPVSHERSPIRQRWWMSSWVNLERREISIIFFDQGVGIPKTLEPTAYEKIAAAMVNLTSFRFSSTPSDGEMIAAATEIFRSGTGTPGRGRGFANMKSFVETCRDGELRVLSNCGKYHYMGEANVQCSDSSQSLGGTVIEWRFRHDGAVEMTDE